MVGLVNEMICFNGVALTVDRNAARVDKTPGVRTRTRTWKVTRKIQPGPAWALVDGYADNCAQGYKYRWRRANYIPVWLKPPATGKALPVVYML